MAGPVYVLDGSSLQLPHTRELASAYPPASNQQGSSHWPLLRVVVMHDVSSGLTLYPQWGTMSGDKAVSEQTLAAAAMEQLPPRAVVVADRNFGVFTVSAFQGASLQAIRRPYRKRGRFASDLESSRWDQPQTRPWPAGASLSGRLIAVRVGRGKSKQWLYLFTTLSDLSMQQIVELYGQRWNIETDLRSLNGRFICSRSVPAARKGWRKSC